MTQSITVRPATEANIPAWLTIAAEVEPIFGPMPDLATPIRRGIAHGTAIVAVGEDGDVVGAALLSRDDQPHRINWLAVRADARRQGAGSALMAALLARWSDGEPIEVITFGADNSGGAPARALYRAHGFHFAEHADNGPEGGSRERWTRP